jgi:hypothetical protein
MVGSVHVGLGEIEIKLAIPRANEKFTSTIALEHKKGLQKGRITMECTFIIANNEKQVSELVVPKVVDVIATPKLPEIVFANDKKVAEKPKLSSSHGAPASTRPTAPRPSSAQKLTSKVEPPKEARRLQNGNEQKGIESDLVKMQNTECTTPVANGMTLRIEKLQIRDAINTALAFIPQSLAVQIKVGNKTHHDGMYFDECWGQRSWRSERRRRLRRRGRGLLV